MKIFTKTRLNHKQIEKRIRLVGKSVQGIEVLLDMNDLKNPRLRETLRLCSDNFETVNLETGDRLYGIKPVDLTE